MMDRRTAFPLLDALESVHSGRLLNACWFAAALGAAIFQMRLLALAWHQDPHALSTACIASTWVTGSALGMRLQSVRRRSSSPPACLWGSGLLAWTLLWVMGIVPAHSSSPLPFLPGPLGSTIGQMGVAPLMGGGSTAWRLQRCPWPAAGERVLLARSALSGTIGLCVVWLVPAWSAGHGTWHQGKQGKKPRNTAWYGCPVVIEVAAARLKEGKRQVLTAINFSPTYRDPLRAGH